MNTEVPLTGSDFIKAEVGVINKVFVAHGIRAAASVSRTVVFGESFVVYRLSLAPSENISNVENVQRELSHAVSVNRSAAGFEPCVLKVVAEPTLTLDVPYPCRTEGLVQVS